MQDIIIIIEQGWQYYMKKQLRERLRSQSNAQLAQSIAYIANANDKSIIHELGDFIDQQNQSNDFYHQERSSFPSRNGLASINSIKTVRSFRNQNNNMIATIEAESLLNRYHKHKIDFARKSDQIYQMRSPTSHLKINTIEEKKSPLKENLLLETSKEDNYFFKIKYDYNKSLVLKNKQFIENNLLRKCQYCEQLKSEVFRNNLVCKNQKCRQIHLFQNFQTFPLIGMLYQIQNQSSTCEQLEESIKKINEQILRIQKQRQSLIQIQFQLQNIVQGRKWSQKLNKVNLKQIMSSIGELKSKRSKQIQNQIEQNRQKIENLELIQVYQQFNRWNKLKVQNYHENKGILESLDKFRPLCLKSIANQISQQIANISDNFNNYSIDISGTQNLAFNFTGNINRMVLYIDGPIHLKRDNFLLIEKLQKMELFFHSRKTSRQLKQLFNILPCSSMLKIQFDYKEHSHVSSETFPILTKACEIAQSGLQIKLLNARPEVFQDILEASKIIKSKSTVKIAISINSYISQNQWPQYSKSKQWGTKVFKTLLKNLGRKIMKLDIQLPLHINMEQISEFLINSDYSMLIQLKIKTFDREIQSYQHLKNLLQVITHKKMVLAGLIANKKKQLSHPLNKNYRLFQSVYHTLF